MQTWGIILGIAAGIGIKGGPESDDNSEHSRGGNGRRKAQKGAEWTAEWSDVGLS